MENTKYPDSSNEPDQEYNDYINDNANSGCSEDCFSCKSPDFDDVLLNSSALTKNSGKDTKYIYTNDSQNTLKDLNERSNKKPKLSFKEQWSQVDELCPNCGAVKVPAKGLNKQNLKKLFSIKGTPEGWVMFFLLCACLFFANLSWDLMTTPVNCSNASIIVNDQQSQLNLNSNNQMPIIDFEVLNNSDSMPNNTGLGIRE